MKTNTHFLSHLTQFFLGLQMFQTKIVEKVKKNILCVCVCVCVCGCGTESQKTYFVCVCVCVVCVCAW